MAASTPVTPPPSTPFPQVNSSETGKGHRKGILTSPRRIHFPDTKHLKRI
jgi:hypothetical protein